MLSLCVGWQSSEQAPTEPLQLLSAQTQSPPGCEPGELLEQGLDRMSSKLPSHPSYSVIR